MELSKIESITILMTAYNSGEYIEQAIKSILNQSYKNFEFIIINDGSTDNTEKVIAGFNDPRIVYYKIKNSGISKATNYGLQKAKNDWVAIMDSDDIAHPHRIEKQLNKMSFMKEEICSTWSIYFRNKTLLFTVDTPINENELKHKLNLHSYICHPAAIYNRHFILENGGYNEELSAFADYDLWLRLKAKAKFTIVPEYLLFMRVSSNSNSRANFYFTRKKVYDIQQKYYNSENLKYSAYELSILNGWREYFYGDKRKALMEWYQARHLIFSDYRILPAIVFLLLPNDLFFKLKELRLRSRMKLLFNPQFDKKTVLEIISVNQLNSVC